MGIQEGVEDAAAWVANTSRLPGGCWIATTPATGPSTESHTARNRLGVCDAMIRAVLHALVGR
jgi:hypothetical protein